jgi:hypothetical protein
MPFALVLIGIILIVTGFQNTYQAFGKQVQGDFSGPGNFFYWLTSIAVIGGIGYIPKLETFSRLFMFLLLLTMIIGLYKKNPAFFSQFSQQISSGSTETVNPIGAPVASGSSASGAASGNSGGSSSGSSIIGDIGTVAGIASLF